jgi:vitamin B12 transporter
LRYGFIILLLRCSLAFSQQETVLPKTLVLPEVVVETGRAKNFSVGQRIRYADSLGMASRSSYSLAEQLTFGNAIYLRHYGANGLATLSMQGASNVHSAVVWNGINLQSVMNGTTDLSQVPSFFVDELGVQQGSASHLWGSGAVGGSVLLQNKANYRSGLSAKSNSEIGSYGQFRQQGMVSFGSQKWFGSVKAFYSEAQNDYPSTVNRQPSTIENAATKQKGILAENYFRWRNNQLAARIWLQDNFRQNPPAEINGNLNHDSRRTQLEYQKTAHKWQWVNRAAWLREELYFRDHLREENTKSMADIVVGETEGRWSPKLRHHLNVGINLNHQQASVRTENYGVLAQLNAVEIDKYVSIKPVRQLLAAFAQYKYNSVSGKLAWQASLRKEWTKQTDIPIIPATGLDFTPWKWLLFKAQVGRFFRLPTFNDLYWKPGGNPDLKPESGWSAEVSLRLTKTWRKSESFYEIAFFKREINDWIRWVPGPSYWSAKNVAKVQTQGIEHRLGTELHWGKHTLKAQASTSYITSQNQQTTLENDASLGIQVIFIPMYQGNGNLQYQYRGFYAEYNHGYTGYVYIANDHSQWLKPYHLGNLVLSQTVTLKQTKLAFTFRICNLWDTEYRTVAAYPMPPRNYQAGITLYFTQLKTKQL